MLLYNTYSTFYSLKRKAKETHVELIQEIGLIYDSIYYCIEYFNKYQTDSYVDQYCQDPKPILDYYAELHEQISALPPILEFFSL